jgi:hypothetical protein
MLQRLTTPLMCMALWKEIAQAGLALRHLRYGQQEKARTSLLVSFPESQTQSGVGQVGF